MCASPSKNIAIPQEPKIHEFSRLKPLFSLLRRVGQWPWAPKEDPEIQLCRKFGYHFRNLPLLRQALKHRSYLVESGESRVSSNERLELLGDSVVGMLITEHLYREFPNKGEGDLTVIKSLAVSRKVLSDIAAKVGIGDFLLLSESERQAGGDKRPSILADAMEAVIGAVYLDGGLDNARQFVQRHLFAELPRILKEEQHRNFKSLLLEYCQKERMPVPCYLLKSEEGPDHEKLFTVQVNIGPEEYGTGSGRSKKRAEQNAARQALKRLKAI